jgi:hypothetical protein
MAAGDGLEGDDALADGDHPFVLQVTDIDNRCLVALPVLPLGVFGQKSVDE